MSTEKTTTSAPVDAIVMPWCDILLEHILQQKGGSFTVAAYWAIGWNGTHWQVFYHGIDAHYRLRHGREKEHQTFREAYEWMESLTAEQHETITSRVAV